MLCSAALTSPSTVNRAICDAAYVTAAAVDSAEPNKTFSQAARTTSPAKPSTQESAGETGPTGDAERVSPGALRLAGPYPRRVEATAIPIASSVITVSAPFATDFSARNSVIRTISPKKPPATIVSHIGKAGERQMWSSDVAHAQFMRDIPCGSATTSDDASSRSDPLFEHDLRANA